MLSAGTQQLTVPVPTGTTTGIPAGSRMPAINFIEKVQLDTVYFSTPNCVDIIIIPWSSHMGTIQVFIPCRSYFCFL